jgi:hypothetical protein
MNKIKGGMYYIVEQPISVFYRYSPKRAYIQFVLGGVSVPETCSVDVFYESSGPGSDPRLVRTNILEMIRMERNEDQTLLTIQCRLHDISKNHMKQRFVFGLRVENDDAPLLFTTAVEMLSKQSKSRKRKRDLGISLLPVAKSEKKSTFRDVLTRVELRLEFIENHLRTK